MPLTVICTTVAANCCCFANSVGYFPAGVAAPLLLLLALLLPLFFSVVVHDVAFVDTADVGPAPVDSSACIALAVG